MQWTDAERITRGRFGRTMATCPLCSDQRRTPANRHNKCLAVTLIEPEFAVYYCNHCEAKGYVRPDTPSRVVDLAERQRRHDEAKRHAEREKSERKRQALTLWDQAQPFRGSPAEDYLLRARGIGDWLDTFPRLDQVFAYHPNCPFGEGARLPCMLALVRDIKTDEPIAVHRTALTTDDPPRKIERKSLGPIAGGAIKISPDDEVSHGLLVGEGIETVLSASAHYEFKPVWSLIDAGNLAKFPALPGIESVTVAVDDDPRGADAAAECIKRLTAGGIEVITTKYPGGDFNDFIRKQRTNV